MPSTCTGIAGPAAFTGLPRSSSSARTRPEYMPQMKSSPTFSVPLCTSTVATGPLPGSSCASTTVPGRALVRVRLEVENFRLQQNLIEQLVDVRSLLRRDLACESVVPPNSSSTTPCCRRSCFTLLGFACGQVDLVDRDDHRHAGVLGVRDRFDRLRHHRVVRRDDEDDDVGDLRTARAHGRERFVARRVEERDVLAARQRDVVRADVLRDAARLAGDDVRLADVVEQRRLAVVDVTHDRDDRADAARDPRACRRPSVARPPRPDTRLRAPPGSRTRRRSARSGRSRGAG